jgi:hypothetical protein
MTKKEALDTTYFSVQRCTCTAKVQLPPTSSAVKCLAMRDLLSASSSALSSAPPLPVSMAAISACQHSSGMTRGREAVVTMVAMSRGLMVWHAKYASEVHSTTVVVQHVTSPYHAHVRMSVDAAQLDMYRMQTHAHCAHLYTCCIVENVRAVVA